jgi:hypothetical protein
MAVQDPTCSRPIDPASEDRRTESAVLAFALKEHPAHLTIPEFSLAMNQDRTSFSDDDEVERAIRELVGAGLLHLAAGFVVPTRAAIYFNSLETD